MSRDHDLRRLWRLAHVPRARLALAIGLASLSLGSAVGLLATSAWLISRASQQPPILFLQVAIVAVRAFGISRGVFRYTERLVGHDSALRSLTSVRQSVFTRLERLSPAGLGQYRHGDLLARLVGDVDTSSDLQVRVALPLASSAVVATGTVVLGWLILPAAGAVLGLLVLLSALVAPAVSGWWGARAQRALAGAQAELGSEVVTGIRASADLFAFGAVDAAMARISAADARATALSGRGATAAGVGAALAALGTGLAVVANLALGIGAVRSGALNGVNLAVLALLPLVLADVLSGLPAAVLSRARVTGAARRVFEVIDAPDPVATPVPVTMGGQALGRAPETSLSASDVGARYPGSPDPVLQGVSLELSGRRRVAVVGPSGSGKSTLAMLLVRFLDPVSGRIALDGRDVRELAEDDVRSRVGYMGQDAYLFDTTIAENIHLADRAAGRAQVERAAVRAGLADWVADLPLGLDTPVGAHGGAVSGGQRQRIALARALLADRGVQILDEPGEHLEVDTADALLADILGSLDRPTLLITHRIAATATCDEVIVLDRGRVVDQGSPQHLRAQRGPYWDLVEREQGAPAVPQGRADVGQP